MTNALLAFIGALILGTWADLRAQISKMKDRQDDFDRRCNYRHAHALSAASGDKLMD